MARSSSPVSPSILTADDLTVKGLQGLSTYTPMTPAYTTAQLLQIQARLTQAEQAQKGLEL